MALTCLTVVLGSIAKTLLGLGPDYLWRATLCFLTATMAVSAFALKSADFQMFGAANRVTLLRVALISLVAATLGETPHNALSWTIVIVVTLALFLDGFDGRIARRTGTSSAFGARFDMETDAALIMILSLLCWQFDKAGIWILAAGAMRYGFVLAGRLLPWMRSPLPYSRRRQAVCIWQSGLLLGVISPVFPVPASGLLAAGTLIMLGSSFAADIRWLWIIRRS
jgi:phosphatidylglycerophosphate synthase